jgi:hypothetical protein
MSRENQERLKQQWAAKWPEALAIWSKFTKLSEPHWCFTTLEAELEGCVQCFSMIRLDDQAIVIDLEKAVESHVEKFPLEILAHEIGHHVLCPSDLHDQFRQLARMRRSLPTLESHAPFIANLYNDLIINDRLQRCANLNVAGIYQAIGGNSKDPGWTFYMRIYEILWGLKKGELAKGKIDPRMEGDAQLGARVVRSYSQDWLGGAGRFAALCFPYFLDKRSTEFKKIMTKWHDLNNCANGAKIPPGLTDFEEDELTGNIHPSMDPELNDELGENSIERKSMPSGKADYFPSSGQSREPFEYGAILKSAGMQLNDHELAVHYYRERALPYLVKFPTIEIPESTDPLPEGLEPWSIGMPLDDIDWAQSVFANGHVIPGMTTLQRVWGTSPGAEPTREPIDLDLYVDSSGSMPNPQVNQSFLALAGAIICLSALRTGSRVQVTLWSGPKQFLTTNGFVTEERRVLETLTGYFGGGTAFPLHILRDTYSQRKNNARKVHVMVISDEGVDTMYNKDEHGNDGYDIAAQALATAGGGGSLVLNLFNDFQIYPKLRRTTEQGWGIYPVKDWKDLVSFARKFSEQNYGKNATGQSVGSPR